MRSVVGACLVVLLAACISPARGQEPIVIYPAGTYSVTVPGAVVIDRGAGWITFRWGAPPPGPTPGPVPPPTPTPGPTPTPVPPPGPTPTPTPTPEPTPPTPAPIADPGLRVLIIYEAADMPKYPGGQVATIYDQTLRDYLNAKCPKGPDGRTAEFRIWDKDTDTRGDTPIWQSAMGRPHPVLPWIVISNGKTGYEGPLPSVPADTLALVKKYEVAP